jgi:hypothetical protein
MIWPRKMNTYFCPTIKVVDSFLYLGIELFLRYLHAFVFVLNGIFAIEYRFVGS